MPLQTAYILNRSVHLAIKENLKMVKNLVSYTDLNFFDDLYQLTPSYQLTPVYGVYHAIIRTFLSKLTRDQEFVSYKPHLFALWDDQLSIAS